MPRGGYSSLHASTAHPPRDSLELASLASSSHTSRRSSLSSSTSGPPSSRKYDFDDEDPLSDHNATNGIRHGRHNRTYSVSSAFDFSSNLFPLSTSASGYTALGAPSVVALEAGNAGSLEKHKSLTYLNGLSLVIGIIIGSGIFSSPSQVNSNAGSLGASLIVWMVSGLLAWTGAASYAELGGAIPLSGGSQVYLSKIYGEWAGFQFTWCALCLMKPGSAAIIAIIFGEYLVRAVLGVEAVDVSPWWNKGVAFGGLVLVTLLNCISTKLGARSADVFMFLKFVALAGVTIAGVVVAVTGFSWKGESSQEWKTHGWFDGTSANVSNWAIAIYAGLWAYDGWDNVNYVTGELKNPSRDLPRIIHTSLLVVILFYLLANISYYIVLPGSIIETSTTIAVDFGSIVLGRVGSLLLALFVAGSCFGALNAGTFTTGRLTYAASKEGFLPGFFSRIGLPSHQAIPQTPRTPSIGGRRTIRHRITSLLASPTTPLFFTPINAMLLNAVLTAGYIAVGEFGSLVTFYAVTSYTFYFASVLGLIILRVREPNLERPYRVWLSTPIIFCCVSLFLLSRAVFAQPLQTLLVVAFMSVGGLVYWVRFGGWCSVRSGREEKSSDWKFWKRWSGWRLSGNI